MGTAVGVVALQAGAADARRFAAADSADVTTGTGAAVIAFLAERRLGQAAGHHITTVRGANVIVVAQRALTGVGAAGLGVATVQRAGDAVVAVGGHADASSRRADISAGASIAVGAARAGWFGQQQALSAEVLARTGQTRGVFGRIADHDAARFDLAGAALAAVTAVAQVVVLLALTVVLAETIVERPLAYAVLANVDWGARIAVVASRRRVESA